MIVGLLWGLSNAFLKKGYGAPLNENQCQSRIASLKKYFRLSVITPILVNQTGISTFIVI